MTREKKAAWIRNAFILLLCGGISVAVFAPEKPKPKPKAQEYKTTTQTTTEVEDVSNVINFHDSSQLEEGQIAEILSEAARKRGGLVVGIIHCHVTGNPESEEMADLLNRIARRYGPQVMVIRVDIIAFPQVAKAEKVTKPPKVVMMAGGVRACKFQGLWTQAQIERKVDELLHGLERMGKNWRPEVPGMQPVTNPEKSTQP